ncbi:MAG: glycine cleavage system protein GcvH [Alphaproteobacteria bacterium]|nr:glycine cleavage system protein GcvH [Alphaproteobacteria bacterium]
MNIPETLRYTDHDEWIRADDDGTVVIGITDFAQDALGDIVFVDLPAVGDTFAAGEALAEVESTKATAEIYTPVAGEVVEVNGELDGSEELVNSDPYGQGWMVRLRAADTSALAALKDAAAYRVKIQG